MSTLHQLIRSGNGIVITDDGLVSSEGGSGPFWFTELENGIGIESTAPTPPNTIPAGQPTTLLSVEIDLAEERTVYIAADFSGSIQGGVGEESPIGFFYLFLDGVEIPLSSALVGYDNAGGESVLATLQLYSNGTIQKLLTISSGTHTIDMRWACQGALPDTSLSIIPGGGRASIYIQAM